jgi:hypothetical protein
MTRESAEKLSLDLLLGVTPPSGATDPCSTVEERRFSAASAAHGWALALAFRPCGTRINSAAKKLLPSYPGNVILPTKK